MRTPRRRAREFALQAMYQYWANPGQSVTTLMDNIKSTDTFVLAVTDKKPRVDEVFFDQLLKGCYIEEKNYESILSPHLDRPWSEVSWVEKAALVLAAYELSHFQETPAAVIINEAVELVKIYGKNESYRFINGVLDQLLSHVRPNEAR